MTLSQRLTRAGLSFIVFGTAVSLMPTDGMAIADTSTCAGGFIYRLTADSSGKTDTAPSTPVTIATLETFYFFRSSDGGTTYAAFTPNSFTATKYTTVPTNPLLSNIYIGTTNNGNNSVTANVTDGPSVSDGTVTSTQ